MRCNIVRVRILYIVLTVSLVLTYNIYLETSEHVPKKLIYRRELSDKSDIFHDQKRKVCFAKISAMSRTT